MGKLKICQWLGVKQMTARELSQKTGISEATISKWRNGKCKPSIENLMKVAEVLNVGLDDIAI